MISLSLVVSTVLKSRLLRRDLAASRFLLRSQDKSRLSRFVETQQDLLRNLDILKTFWGKSGPKISTNWEILIEKYDNSWSRSRQTVKKYQNFQISMNFLISMETFWSRHWCQDKIEESRSWPKFLNCRDALFDAVKIFSTVETHSLTMLRSRLSIETRSRQIKTPRLIFIISF